MTNIHPLQSILWGEFRKKTGVKVIRINDLQLTIHSVPYTQFTIGYLPKAEMPNKEIIEELIKIGRSQNCIFIQLEPNVITNKDIKLQFKNLNLIPSAHPLLTKYNFILDLNKPEDELLKNMHHKTRYNIRLAQKKGVKIIEDNSNQAFKDYLRLTKETTNRQKFYAHNENYHRLMWEMLSTNNQNDHGDNLTAHLFKAIYKGETLVTWMLFVLGDTLYYPYGASSTKYREVMASNLMMWEAIKFGKKLGLKSFDMWGALGPNPDNKDPWYGFHHFKEGYGPKHIEYVGSYDLVINKYLYLVFKILDKIRWFILKFK